MKVLAKVAYERLEQIGAGQGMNSIVYRARDPQLAGVIAIKEIEKADFGNDVADYFAEAQAMHETKHDHIVPVHYACATETHVCIAMPFFEKGSFASMVKAGPAPAAMVLRVGSAVLLALAQVHLAGLLHLDVKPSNVLLSDRGVPMLADFGQSRRVSPTGVATVPRLYTWGVPPEAFRGVVAVPSDVYQAALLLYRAANGDPHFNRQRPSSDPGKLRLAIEGGRFPRRDEFMPHVPQRLRTVIRKGLRVDPSERYQSATEFADALGRVACERDWVTVVESSGALVWRAARPDQPTLVVTAEPNASVWKTAVFTESGGQRRAKGKSLFWRDGLTWKQACVHLTEVFENLR